MSTGLTDVNKLGEFGLIEHLTRSFHNIHESTIRGIGDDAAVIDMGSAAAVISTDLLVEGIHFDLMYSPMKHIGYKAVIVNLSDIYAMNVVPTHITVSIAISSKYSVEALEELYQGIENACKLYKVDLIGGDTTSSPKGMTISVTAIGIAHDPSKIVYRSGATVGDILCLTGDIGGAYLGLQLLEREKQLYLSDKTLTPDFEGYDYIIERQLKPEAAKFAIEFFSKNNILPTSMIDLSDGLSSDLMHICKQSGVGAYLEEAKLPMQDQVRELALKFNIDPITCALNGGEDYELLFSICENDLEKIRFMPDVYIVGEIVDKADGVTLHGTSGRIHPLTAQGWNHFEK